MEKNHDTRVTSILLLTTMRYFSDKNLVYFSKRKDLRIL